MGRTRRLPTVRTWRRVAFLTLLVAAAFYAAAWIVPLPERLSATPSTVVTFRDGSPAFVFLSADDKYRMAVDLDAVDPDYTSALLRYEDQRFRAHPGVDPIAVFRSLFLNLQAGRIVSGASTITMQLVRVLEPRPRSLRSKIVEALRALQIEARFSKDEVLAAYMTFIPFGGNLEGVEAASHAYFGHGPKSLTPAEISTLLAVPQSPTRRHPAPANTTHLKEARDHVASWLGERRLLQANLEVVLAEPVPRTTQPMPREAPHAAFWLRTANAQNLHIGHIATTLDRGVQRVVERRLAAAAAELGPLGIHNGAAVVIDHESAEVLALVGSFDFWAQDHGGQIAGFLQARSPGSALKPFIYALAVDRGLALPEQLMADVPTVYGAYAPSNYDGELSGLVRLEEALAESLNIPFVRLLREVGVERFAANLRQMGAGSLKSEPGYYGLSAAIGAMEVTPLELSAFYTVLAQEGRYRPLRWLVTDETPDESTEIFSPGASYLTSRALRRRDRPDFPSRRRYSGTAPTIQWKTGTSYGHRDAWAAGSDDRLTAVVWLGNFDQKPSVDLVGADAAGPILFDLLEGLADRASVPTAPRPSNDLKMLRVCALSGHIPTNACPELREVWGLRRRVPTQRCPYHLALDIDLESGLALNPSCRAGRRYERRSFVVWPAEVRRFLTAQHQVLPKPPALLDGCVAQPSGRGPRMISPPANEILVLVPGIPATDQEVPLIADTAAGSRLAWFINGQLVGQTLGDEELWWTPRPGRHEVLVQDNAGRSSRRFLEVREGAP